MTLLFYIIFLVLGATIAYLFSLTKTNRERKRWHESEGLLQELRQEKQRLNDELVQLRQENGQHREAYVQEATQNSMLREQIVKQQAELESQQKRLTVEFENIANRILKERSAELTATSRESLGALLNPLGQRIEDFQKQVGNALREEMRDKVSLREEVKKLTELNSRVSTEANNLTKALKGDVKQQGNWGEIILERVLESSGLVQGREFEREVVVEAADGSRQRPDVIINLPEGKHIIVDSKVSLVAYERMVNATDEEAYAKALKEHTDSLRNHIKGLSEKNYTHAKNVNSPDFVLMFLPIESSFASAIQHDQELFKYGWDRKIIVVSPTTLLATLRTVASIWKQENQTRNALEIARLSGSMYDKLVLVVSDMKRVKESIEKAGKTADEAMKRMSEGHGNVIRTAERIKELGAKTEKSLPTELIE